MAPFDICEMSRQIIISFEQKIEAKHLSVEFDADDDNILVNGDHDAIYQILYNICDNAVKFSCDGGLFKVSIKNKDKKVAVSVYNEGEGIPYSDQPYIFERFYKGKNSDDKSFGVGLALARMIITSQNGTVKAENRHPKGATFSIRFYKGTV